MASKTPSLLRLSLLLHLVLQIAAARDYPSKKNQKISAFFALGDSTADPGNNNYLLTVAKANFPPYGRDFPNHKATGRFTNGLLVNDILVKILGIKSSLPPYLNRNLTLNDLRTGVSFASAASGYDPLTPSETNVLSLSKQLKYLKEYKQKLESKIGTVETKKMIDNAFFIASAGTNDFVINYFSLPTRRLYTTLPNYMKFILKKSRELVLGLVDQGALHIGVVGLPPIGCVPMMITLFSDNPMKHRDCISNMSSAARDYNELLKAELNSMQAKLKSAGVRIAYLDAYTPLEEMTLKGNKYGFETTNIGCCGTGALELGPFCNKISKLCDDVNKYVFWDSVHPTERAYFVTAKYMAPAIESLFKK